MYTQCPHCAARFVISSEQLEQAAGRACCGVCEREFDALERLRLPEPCAEVPRLGGSDAPRQGELFVVEPLAEDVPGFIRAQALATSTHTARWLAAVLLLGVVLFAQLLLAQRLQLAADVRWRPWLEAVCDRLGCSLAAWHAPQDWKVLAREIGPHPSADQALLVTATLRNDGAFAQALPQLELTLSNLDGNALALRRFAPSEYAGVDWAHQVLQPGETLSARLELVDPGKDALAFALEFH